jgi:alkylated DNA repair dioxygenase AlkB
LELFATEAGEELAVPDAAIVLWREVDFDQRSALLDKLIAETPWQAQQITVWGKTYPQPRLVAWYGDDALSYTYSGITLSAAPWTPVLQAIRDRVEALCDCRFNSVLLNYYRNHRDSMGMHADDEPELGPAPAIASVSFGATRQFVMQHKTRREIGSVRLPLSCGSVLLMKGAMQANWKHGIPKERKPCGPRVNLTFRTILE